MRRTSTPTVPMPNSTAPSTRYHGVGVGTVAARSAIGLTARPARRGRPSGDAPAGEQHGAGDGDDEQHDGELEGEHVVAEEVVGELADVGVVVAAGGHVEAGA